MNFRDAQLQKCYDGQLVEAGETSDGLCRVHALIATHNMFQRLEGDHLARVHETVECLLSAELRPELRRWYRRPEVGADRATVEFRDQLSGMVGGSSLKTHVKPPITPPELANVWRA